MARVCDNCGKSIVYGSSRQHRRGVAGKRWKKRVTPTPRLFKPNLQYATVLISGMEMRMKLCTKCIKRFKKEGKLKAHSPSQTLSA